jgi:hypothetical protein
MLAPPWALEFHAVTIKEAANTIAAAIDNLAAAVRESQE